jgi:acyl-CoA synthetase (AMP-forming)/AMP-acid ligase II
MSEERRDGVRGDLELGTVARLVGVAAARHGSKRAIEDGERAWTFEELEAQVLRATRALIARGVERGDRVSIWAPNRPEWVIAALAVHSAGAVLVPINTR